MKTMVLFSILFTIATVVVAAERVPEKIRTSTDKYEAAVKQADEAYDRAVLVAKRNYSKELQQAAAAAAREKKTEDADAITEIKKSIDDEIKLLESVSSDFVTGLIIYEYSKDKRQAVDSKLFVKESELGEPARVYQGGLSGAPGDKSWSLPGDRTAFAKGWLKIDRDGEYGFTTYGHHTGGSILVIGKVVIRQDETDNSYKVTFVKLRKGLIPIMSIGRIGNGGVDIKWKPPGAQELSLLPATSVVCRPLP